MSGPYSKARTVTGPGAGRFGVAAPARDLDDGREVVDGEQVLGDPWTTVRISLVAVIEMAVSAPPPSEMVSSENSNPPSTPVKSNPIDQADIVLFHQVLS